MAKKRGKEEEKSGFQIPEFDEEEYVEKEIRDGKASFLTIGFAAAMSLASFALMMIDNGAALGILVGFMGLVLLRQLYIRAGLDVSKIEKKGWVGNGIIYMFSWLAIWIILINPPISDFASPQIAPVELWGEELQANETVVVLMNDSNRLDLLNVGENLTIRAVVDDNYRLVYDSVVIEVYHGLDNVTPETGEAMERINNTGNTYRYRIQDLRQGDYTFTIHASDEAGHRTRYRSGFAVAA